MYIFMQSVFHIHVGQLNENGNDFIMIYEQGHFKTFQTKRYKL